MSFSATIYNCGDDPRKAVKNLTSGIPVASIVPTEDCDILNPTFILNYNPSYTACNYIVIGAPFNRSYFITDEKISIGKKIEISCAVDVLGTYWDQIKGNTVNVVRQENLKEPYLPDDQYKIYTDFQNKTYLPAAADIANLLAESTGKNFIVSYVGAPRTSGGGN